MGGKPPKPPRVPTPQEEAEARMWERREQERLQKEEDDRRRTEIAGEVDRGVLGFMDRGADRFRNMGIDYGGGRYEEALRRKADHQRQLVPDLADDPLSYFSDSVIDNVVDDLTSQDRRGFRDEFGRVAPTGFESSTFGDTADDAVLSEILGGRYETNRSALQRHFDRGRLDQTGLDYALDLLNSQRTTADSRLQSIGGGVLSGYRDNLTELSNRGYDAIDAYELGSDFSLDPYTTDLQSRIDLYNNSLEGDINNAIGGEEFFDLDSILTQAGVKQGILTGGSSGAGGIGAGPSSGALFQAMNQDNKKKSSGAGNLGGSGRGLGSQGIY